MTEWDAPNQQVVRPDQSAPWEEGEGGSTGGPPPAPRSAEADGDSVDLDSMTKEQLLAYAQNIGVSPANASMNKDELRAGIDAKLAERGGG